MRVNHYKDSPTGLRDVDVVAGMKWREYEARKQAWIDANLGATSFTFDKAILLIAREVGV